MHKYITFAQFFQDLGPRQVPPKTDAYAHAEVLCQFLKSLSLGTIANNPVLCPWELGMELSKGSDPKFAALPVEEAPKS
jgi:hypothetical protein